MPPAGADVVARERAVLRELASRAHATIVPDDSAARLDAKLMRAQIAATLVTLDERPRHRNPVWYTGEIAFGLIALMLPGAVAREPRDFAARLAAVPDFLSGATVHLAAQAVPADWVRRARQEIAAIRRLLAEGLPLHPFAAHIAHALTIAADVALERFDVLLARLPDADPACGAPYLTMLMRDVHGLAQTPATLEREAVAAYDEALATLCEAAARLDAQRDWRAQLDALAELGVRDADVLADYRTWHERALRDGVALLTPAHEYGLDFAYVPQWARAVAGDLYFLFYRSPAAYAAGNGSTYWVAPPSESPETGRRAHDTAAVKTIHAVHHGSIGHHTQNARARAAGSRLARIAGTDCAAGMMFLGAGTMVEGWACYAEDLLAEMPDFYTPAERLQLAYFRLRNIACCLADIRLHVSAWTLADMRAFYRDDVAFAPARIWSETTRNSIFPASRLMYWTGTAQIAALRARSPLAAKPFHDALLAFGSAPVAWIAEELMPCAPSAHS